MAFQFSDLQRIPRSVLEQLEVCPTGLAGTVPTWCIWNPADEPRAAAARAALRTYLPDAELELVQAIATPEFDPRGWFTALLDRVYGPAPTPTPTPRSCSACGDRERPQIEGRDATVCDRCCTIARATAAESGQCRLCAQPGAAHRVGSIAICDACLALADEIARR